MYKPKHNQPFGKRLGQNALLPKVPQNDRCKLYIKLCINYLRIVYTFRLYFGYTFSQKVYFGPTFF